MFFFLLFLAPFLFSCPLLSFCFAFLVLYIVFLFFFRSVFFVDYIPQYTMVFATVSIQ